MTSDYEIFLAIYNVF